MISSPPFQAVGKTITDITEFHFVDIRLLLLLVVVVVVVVVVVL